MLPGVVLRMARLVRQGTGPQSTETPAVREAARKPPVKTLVVPAVDLVQLIAKASSSSKLLPPPSSLPTLQYFFPPELTPYAALSPPNLFPKLSLFTVSPYDGSDVPLFGSDLLASSLAANGEIRTDSSIRSMLTNARGSWGGAGGGAGGEGRELQRWAPEGGEEGMGLDEDSYRSSSRWENGERGVGRGKKGRDEHGMLLCAYGGVLGWLEWWTLDGGEEGMGLDEDSYRSSSRWDGGEGRQIVEGKGAWDQFEANRKLFGVETSFDEAIYTTPLVRPSRELQAHAERIAREIESQPSRNMHTAEERGFHLRNAARTLASAVKAALASDDPSAAAAGGLGGNADSAWDDDDDIDEETKYSSVIRSAADLDSGMDDEVDDANDETFGDAAPTTVHGT
ncbi:unnamed protein product, partial [Closterium sp. NIES-65]